MSAALEVSDLATLRPRTDPVARARAVVPIIAAAAPRIEAGRALTEDVLDALHGAALFRTLLPRAFNGEEVTPATFVRMQEIIAAADASTGWCLGQASGCSMAAAYLAPEAAWEIWGKDPRGAVAWGMGNGMAEVEAGGYRVTGTWRFASGAKHATWIGGHCRVKERDGSLRLGADGQPIERTMMIRKDRIEFQDAWNVVGLRGTGSDTYGVAGLFVPDEYTVCRDTDAERRLPGTLYQFSTTHIYASGFAGVSMGIARGMLDEFTGMAMRKTPAATTRAMRDSEVIQNGLAQNEAKLRSARAFLLETLEEAWETVAARGHITMAEKVLIRLASTSAIHRAKEVVEWAYHEAGATAIFQSEPFERRMRDIHASGQQVQGRTAHLEVCGQHFLGLNPQARFI
ncbi:MAG: acyl-CoA dehydrogenase [Belnapia sp.]|nr:acyl-CoA dehydrogenase [Belnapia sp.]